MKTLKVYTSTSHQVYSRLYEEHLYEIDKDNLLTIIKRNTSTGEEVLIACFRNWEYFIIE